MSPWKEIWIRPRAAIRGVIESNPNRALWFLASIYGFDSLMNSCQKLGLGYTYNQYAIFLFSAVFSFLWGYLVFAIWSGALYLTGKIFKGEGTFSTIRAAYAWSCVPLAGNIPLWILLAALFGPQLFTSSLTSGALTNQQVFVLFLCIIGRLTFVIWSLVIFFNALAEVQRYSILKAILNTLCAALFLTAVYMILWWIGAQLFTAGNSMPRAGTLFWSESYSLEALREYIR